MVKETELYELLGCAPDADAETLKHSFRKAALKWHPDRFSSAPESERAAAEKKFAEINNAYDILKEPDTRERYDRGGMKGVQEGGDEGGPGFFTRARREPKPKDIMHKLEVPLEQFFTGAVRKLAVMRRRLCSACDGSGSKSGKDTICPDCKGQGAKNMLRQIAPGFVQQMQVACGTCKTTGQVVAPGDACATCNAERVVEDRKTFEVHIEKGMKHGDAVTFADEGTQVPGIRKCGDVVFLLEGTRHERFVRKGRALLTKVKVPLADALCGFQLQIVHLDGRTLVINSTEGQILTPDMRCLVAREGMPVKGTGGSERGDLVVQVEVVFPATLNAAQQEKLRTVLGPMTPPKMPVGVSVAAEGSYETIMNECHSKLEDLAKDGRQHDDEEEGGGPGVRACC